MSKIVAIHQPNFFPWLGYFDKIARSDLFLFFDDVQFPKTGGVWCNRVKLLIGGEARWITAAIDRKYHGTRQVRQMHFLASTQWCEKMLKGLDANYRRHPFYADTISFIEPLIRNSESNIAEYNIHAVTEIAQRVGLDTNKFKRTSDIEAEGSSTELLISLTLHVGGCTYMCGGGADGYQDEALFAHRCVQLCHQNFQHPVYPQRGQIDFVPGLSIIDAAMNLGWEGLQKLLQVTS